MKYYAIIPRKNWAFEFHYLAKTPEAFKEMIERAYWNWRASQSSAAAPETVSRAAWRSTVRFVVLEVKEAVLREIDPIVFQATDFEAALEVEEKDKNP